MVSNAVDAPTVALRWVDGVHAARGGVSPAASQSHTQHFLELAETADQLRAASLAAEAAPDTGIEPANARLAGSPTICCSVHSIALRHGEAIPDEQRSDELLSDT